MTGTEGLPQWSPDGRTIIFLGQVGNLYQLGFGVVDYPSPSFEGRHPENSDRLVERRTLSRVYRLR